MSAMRVVQRCGRSVLVLTFLPLLWLAVAKGAPSSGDVNEVSKEERAALKEKPCSNIMVEYADKGVPLERVATLLAAKLKDESILETLSKLQEPGFQGDVAGLRLILEGRTWTKSGIPLPRDSDHCADDLLTVLNNPRFAKLLQELPRMSRNRMATLMIADLQSSLVLYDKSYQEFFRGGLEYFNSIKNDPTGKLLPMSFETIGLRQRVLALLMLAGHLQLRECQPSVQKIADYAIEQRDRLYDQTLSAYDFATVALDQETLYHRQILATALLQTSLTPKEAEQVLADIGARYRERKVKPYDQMFTYVHLPHSPKGQKMKRLRVLDDEKGTIAISHVEELDDPQFNKLVEAVRKSGAQGALPLTDAPRPKK